MNFVTILKKNNEIIKYLIFGGLTTLVNIAIYFILATVFNMQELISSGIAWIIAVIFAYITNKLYVFNNTDKTNILKEFSSFVGFRVITGLMCDIVVFAILIYILNIDDLFAKIITQVIVIILNYIFSKFIIFKKN